MQALQANGLCRLQKSASPLVARWNWRCARHAATSNLPTRRRASDDASSAKPFYVTTPIFYVNAAPHIGHLYTTVLSDVIKRWQQLKGHEAYLCTGTDEHGMKIQRAAAKEGIPPKEFCDGNSTKFRELAQLANISNDFFIRTTDQDHKDAVAQFWLQLKYSLSEGLGLYKGTHEGWYCVSDECFYPEDMVQPSIVPQTGKKIMINTESENEVEWVKEETWFFPLTKYRDALLKFYDENPDWIKPEHRMKEVRDWVENHLEDLSITRPQSRLSWGIPDPEDSSQTIYVWVDALINYITKAGYGKQWQVGSKDTGIWPADVQVIGKDILRFHAIYWPALLLALGLKPAKKLICHNHWTMSNRKMSKSLGNVVNPVFAIQRWDIDPLRYFLMRNGSFSKDMSYSNDTIAGIYVKELQANIGNLFYRIAKPKANARWSLQNAVRAFHGGSLGNVAERCKSGTEDAKYMSLEPHLDAITSRYTSEMDDFNMSNAIREVFELLRETNRFVTDTEPWKIAKLDTAESQELLNWVVYSCGEALRISAILLQPIMPAKTARLLDELGVQPSRRTLEWAHKGKDDSYGTETAMAGDVVARTHKWDTIFPPTASAEMTDQEVLQLLKTELASKTRNKMNQMVELLALEARLGDEGVNKLIADAKIKTAAS